MQLHWEGVLLSEFLPKCFHTVHLSGDGGIPITLLFDFLSKFPWTDLKNILSFCSYMTPLWNGRFILDGHPFVETLASVGNSVYFVHEFCVIIISLHARIESNLKKIPRRNRRRHFDKRDALI